MYLFGFPEGLAGGSKETIYLTNYNTSHGTTRSTNFGTGWYTNRNTSHPTSKQTWKDTTIATAWNSVGNTGWITTFDTGQTIPTYTRGIRKNIDSTVVGADLGRMFWISNDNGDGVAYLNLYVVTMHFSTFPILTANDGGQFIDLNMPHNDGWYRIQSLKCPTTSASIWINGVLQSGYPKPDYNALYNANEIIIYIYASNFNLSGFYYDKIKMDNTRDTGSHSFQHFYPRTSVHVHESGSYNSSALAIWGPSSVSASASGVSPIDENIPYGSYNTSWTTSGPMTYKSTTFALSRNTAFPTSYSTSYATGYGTSAYTSKTTSRGTGYTTTYGTSHTTDHITYG